MDPELMLGYPGFSQHVSLGAPVDERDPVSHCHQYSLKAIPCPPGGGGVEGLLRTWREVFYLLGTVFLTIKVHLNPTRSYLGIAGSWESHAPTHLLLNSMTVVSGFATFLSFYFVRIVSFSMPI